MKVTECNKKEREYPCLLKGVNGDYYQAFNGSGGVNLTQARRVLGADFDDISRYTEVDCVTISN